MNSSFSSLRDFLRNCIAERKAKNPRYTTSAFAKKIGLSPAMVSEVLKGRKFLSKERCYGIARELNLNESDTEYLALLAEQETAKDSNHKIALARRLLILNHFRSSRSHASGDKPPHTEDLNCKILETLKTTSEGFYKIRSLTQHFVDEVLEIAQLDPSPDQTYQIGVELIHVKENDLHENTSFESESAHKEIV